MAVMAITAEEEDLGDLKLFRVPVPVDVSAQGMKQVAFLNREDVEASFLYLSQCNPMAWVGEEDVRYRALTYLVTKNDEEMGLGIALPQGQLIVYEPTSRGPQLGASTDLRDYARGQDIELELAESNQVFTQCGRVEFAPNENGWTLMTARFVNANPHPVTVRLRLARASERVVNYPAGEVYLKDGWRVVDVELPANYRGETRWYSRSP